MAGGPEVSADGHFTTYFIKEEQDFNEELNMKDDPPSGSGVPSCDQSGGSSVPTCDQSTLSAYSNSSCKGNVNKDQEIKMERDLGAMAGGPEVSTDDGHYTTYFIKEELLDFDEELDIQDQKPVVCEVCAKCFSTKMDLIIHKKNQHGSTCRELLTNTSKTHMAPLAVDGSMLETESTSKESIVNHNHSFQNKFKNNKVCDKTVNSYSSETLTSFNDDSGNVNSQPSSISVQFQQNDEDRKPTKGEKPFSCNICGKAYSRYSRLKEHERIHTGHKPHSCNVCGKTFNQSCHLKQHKRIHTGEKPFSCDVCGKAFNQSSSLKQHSLIHTGEKPFSCNVCGKAFNQSYHLKIHKHCHTGKKLFSCNVCGKAFNMSAALKRHNRIHTGEKPFSCDVCGKAFNRSSVLKRHNRIHTGQKPFSCHVCGKAFNQSDNLKQHEYIHTGEKPFSCRVCGKAFNSSGHLKRHERIHT